MKRNNLYVSLMAFAILLVGASCSDDDNTPSYSTGVVQNTELKTILVQRGYTYNDARPLRNTDFHRCARRTFHVP